VLTALPRDADVEVSDVQRGRNSLAISVAAHDAAAVGRFQQQPFQ